MARMNDQLLASCGRPTVRPCSCRLRDYVRTYARIDLRNVENGRHHLQLAKGTQLDRERALPVAPRVTNMATSESKQPRPGSCDTFFFPPSPLPPLRRAPVAALRCRTRETLPSPPSYHLSVPIQQSQADQPPTYP